jgi:hypothetical protein
MGFTGQQEAVVLPGEDGPDLSTPSFIRNARELEVQPEPEVRIERVRRDELAAELGAFVTAVRRLQIATQFPEIGDPERWLEGDVKRTPLGRLMCTSSPACPGASADPS